MSKFAKQSWCDINGGVFDTEEDALTASREAMVANRMRREYGVTAADKSDGDRRRIRAAAFTWFLDSAEDIIAKYSTICDEVDEEMKA